MWNKQHYDIWTRLAVCKDRTSIFFLSEGLIHLIGSISFHLKRSINSLMEAVGMITRDFKESFTEFVNAHEKRRALMDRLRKEKLL